MSQIPKCVCGFTCGAIQLQEEYKGLRKLNRFLMGLNVNLTAVRGQILRMTPLPTMSHAVSILIEEEGERECTVSGSPITVSDMPTVLLSKRLLLEVIRMEKLIGQDIVLDLTQMTNLVVLAILNQNNGVTIVMEKHIQERNVFICMVILIGILFMESNLFLVRCLRIRER